jgi:hypothetical protein
MSRLTPPMRLTEWMIRPPVVLETEGVGAETEPEKVALDARDLSPDEAQPAGTLWHLDVHDRLEGNAVAHAVHEAADAADALDHEAHLGVLDALDHHLETAVDVADGRDRVHDLLVHQNEVQHEWLRQNRVLRPERDRGSLHDFTVGARGPRGEP